MRSLRKTALFMCCMLVVFVFAGTKAYAGDLDTFDESGARTLYAGYAGTECKDAISMDDGNHRYVLTATSDGKLSMKLRHEVDETDDFWYWNIFKLVDGEYRLISESKVYVDGETGYIVDIPCVKGDKFGVLLKEYEKSGTGYEYELSAEIVTGRKKLQDGIGSQVYSNWVDILTEDDPLKIYNCELEGQSGRLSITFTNLGSYSEKGWEVEVYDEGNYKGSYTIAATSNEPVKLPNVYTSYVSDPECFDVNPSRVVIVVRPSAEGMISNDFRIATEMELYYDMPIEYCNETFGRAVEIGEKGITGLLTEKTESNYYKYEATKDGCVTFKIEDCSSFYNEASEGVARIYCFDKDTYRLNKLEVIKLEPSPYLNVTVPAGCRKGDIFYIVISNSRGSTTSIKAVIEECEYEKENNNTFQNATSVQLIENEKYFSQKTMGGNIADGDDIDIYEYTMPVDGGFSFMIGRDDALEYDEDDDYDEIFVSVYRESVSGVRDLVYRNAAGFYLNTLYMGGKKGDKFYVRLNVDEDDVDYSIGYKIDAHVTKESIYELELNNTPESATPIDTDGSMNGRISQSNLDPADYYAFTTIPGERVGFRLIDHNITYDGIWSVKLLSGDPDDFTTLLSGGPDAEGNLFEGEGLVAASTNTFYIEIKCNDYTKHEYTLELTSSITGPEITKQPESATVTTGTIAAFSVSAKGEGLKYLWQYMKKNEHSWTDWTTKTKADITVAYEDSRNGMRLRCMITDKNGRTAYSDEAILKYEEAGPAITKQPESTCVAEGTLASFSVATSEKDVSYLWQYKKKGDKEWTDWTTKTTADITVAYDQSRNEMLLRCKLTNGKGLTTFSNEVTLTYKSADIDITEEPRSATISAGEMASFSMAAKGTKLSYLWQYKKKGESTWTDWTTKTKAAITVAYDKSRDGMSLRCKVTDGNGTVSYSKEVTLAYKTAAGPVITKQPVNAAVNAGTLASFSLTATGTKVTYLWQYKKKGATTWTDWTTKTSAAITVAYDKSRDGMSLRCKLTDGNKNITYSNVVTLTYKAGPVITKQPVSVTVKAGEMADFSVTATGTKLTYLWQYKPAGSSSWVDWTSKTKASMNVAYLAKRDGMSLRCKITDGNGNYVFSDQAVMKYNK